MTAQPRLIISESTSDSPILIIDNKGIIAGVLLEKLKEQWNIVFASAYRPEAHNKITYVPYHKKTPILADIKYAAILVIYHGEKTTLEMLSALAKKAEESNAPLLFVSSIHLFSEKLKKQFLRTEFEKIQIALYGDVFENVMLEENIVTQYIHQVRSQKKIDIPGNGLLKTHPVLFEDICTAVMSLLFSSNTSGPVLILPKHGFTLLALARAFQKIDPLLKINFTKQKIEFPQPAFPQDSKYYFPEYNLAQKLKKIDLNKKVSDKKKTKKISSPKFYRQGRWTFVLIGLLFFLLPLILSLLLLLSGTLFLYQSVSFLQKNDFATAQKYNITAKYAFASAEFLTRNASGFNPILFMQKEPLLHKALIGKNMSEVEEDILHSAFLIQAILDEQSANPKNDFHVATAKIKNSLVQLQKLEAQKELPAIVSDKLNTLEYPLNLFANTIDTYPELLGFNGKRKYLILFQNNMELRPGGGFIGSYGLLEIQNGKVVKFEINDIYDADGKLTTHIEPPFFLRRYLGASHLFLRDSNYDIDFPKNAARARSIFELETGEKVDGIIAIDTNALKNLLTAIGPLNIPDYKQNLTADNFFLITETHAEKDFFPGSTQKKDFLRAVYNSVEQKLAAPGDLPYLKLIEMLGNSIRQKHILIAHPDSDLQATFSSSKLSNTLLDNREKEQNTFLDFLGINEANLGMNKTNFYLNRSIEQNVTIKDSGDITEKVSIIYENRSTKDSEFGGDYKNYLRFILPQNAQLQSVEVNNTVIPTTAAITGVEEYTAVDFIPPSELEIEKTQEFEKTIIGFLVIIPLNTSQKISITYSIPAAYSMTAPVFTYNSLFHKQPGTQEDLYSLTLSYPVSYKPLNLPPTFSNVGGKLLYSEKIGEDKNIILNFSGK